MADLEMRNIQEQPITNLKSKLTDTNPELPISPETLISPEIDTSFNINTYVNIETGSVQHKLSARSVKLIIISIATICVAAIIVIIIFATNATSNTHSIVAAEANPPNWPSSVYVLDSSNMTQVREIVNKIKSNTQFSDKHYALLFKPGSYNITIAMNYYVSIIGLGRTPKDVQIANIICRNNGNSGALQNFWRSIENIYTKPTLKWNSDRVTMLWSVSQASHIRNVYIDGNLDLWEADGYSSGGYISNSIINGTITSGTQQQFYLRNINMSSFNGGVWNMVFQGVQNAPETICPGYYTTIRNTPVIAEKPFINIMKNGSYQLIVPQVQYHTAGACVNMDECPSVYIDFSRVYVTNPETDNALSINNKLKQGIKYMVISAGVYYLDEAITIIASDTVLMGIGFPTMIAAKHNTVIEVKDNIVNVRIAGLLLEAGSTTDTLLKFGSGSNEDINRDIITQQYSFIYDIFVRVGAFGGASNSNEIKVSSNTMIEINSNNVVMDNIWCWRADHDIYGLVKNGTNFVATGLKVNGDNVTTYGLAVEHTLNNLVEWNGNNGSCYFYQCELAYDVTQHNYGDLDYVGFRVNDDVDILSAFGMGIYSYFRDYNVSIKNGIQSPINKINVKFTNVFTKYLNGNGGFKHVINDIGQSSSIAHPQPQYVCHY